MKASKTAKKNQERERRRGRKVNEKKPVSESEKGAARAKGGCRLQSSVPLLKNCFNLKLVYKSEKDILGQFLPD